MFKKILVTGAGGFLGTAVISRLFEDQYEVVGLYRKLPEDRHPWESIEIDLDDQKLDLSGKDFDCVIHCAAVIPNDFFGEDTLDIAETNKKIDKNVIDHCSEKGIRLIYISSASVYGFTDSKIDEYSPLNPSGLYSLGKLKSEVLIREKLQNYVVLRVNAPYANWQKQNTVLKIFIENAVADLDITYHGSGKRMQDFTHVSDIAHAVKCCLIHENVTGIFNIASGRSISMRSLAEMIVSLTAGCQSKILPSGKADVQENYRPQFDISKAKKFLGWEPAISPEAGISQWINSLQ